jgi:hypothetical protein
MSVATRWPNYEWAREVRFLSCLYPLGTFLVTHLHNSKRRTKAHVSAGLSGCAERIIFASMSALLSSVVQEGDIWRVKIVWPNRHVNYFGKFTSERDAIAWITAHSNLTKPEDTIDEPFNRPGPLC